MNNSRIVDSSSKTAEDVLFIASFLNENPLFLRTEIIHKQNSANNGTTSTNRYTKTKLDASRKKMQSAF